MLIKSLIKLLAEKIIQNIKPFVCKLERIVFKNTVVHSENNINKKCGKKPFFCGERSKIIKEIIKDLSLIPCSVGKLSADETRNINFRRSNIADRVNGENKAVVLHNIISVQVAVNQDKIIL